MTKEYSILITKQKELSNDLYYEKLYISEKDAYKIAKERNKQNGIEVYSSRYLRDDKDYMDYAEMRLVYFHETDEWYIPNETIPYPKSNTVITEKFALYLEDEGFISVPYAKIANGEKEFHTPAALLIYIENKDDYSGDWLENVIEWKNNIGIFIRNLKELKFAVYNTNSTIKFIAWEKEDYIRFIIQDYEALNDYGAFINYYDRFIPKELFYSEFEKIIIQAESINQQNYKNYKQFLNNN